MKYYKDTNNKPFVFEDNVTAEIIAKVEGVHNTSLIEITKVDFEAIIAPTFVELQAKKLGYVKESFNTALQLGFTCTNNIKMDADLKSVQTFSSGYDLAIKLSATTMNITDYDNAEHLDIPIADTDNMLIELGVNYSTLRAKKNTLKAQVNSTTTQAGLDLIVW